MGSRSPKTGSNWLLDKQCLLPSLPLPPPTTAPASPLPHFSQTSFPTGLSILNELGSLSTVGAMAAS